MSDLRVRFGIILAMALFPIMLFAIYMAYNDGRFLLVVISLLAWAFAYLAIWLATDKLIFSHLRTLKKASDDFSKGNLFTRIGIMHEAPARLQDLGNAFDRMAENISERELRLLDNINEKEILLREIHHRVKNNLQIIISLLNMQERKLHDAAGLTAIQETRSRINAIALVHRGLYEGDDLRVIDMPVFLSRLVDELKSGLILPEQDVEININIAPSKLETDTAIPVALFVVEALTNAIKHGVGHGGSIDIDLKKSRGDIMVSVKDDGSGVKSNAQSELDGKSLGGTGAKLIKGFARQLSGRVKTEELEKGYRVILEFPNSQKS